MFFHYLNSQPVDMPLLIPFPCQYFYQCPQNFDPILEEKQSSVTGLKHTIDLQNHQIQSIKPKEDQKTTKQRRKNDKQKKNLKENAENQEYLPENQGPNERKKGKQNVLRNILPNIMHQAFTFVQKKSRSGELVNRLLKGEEERQGSIERFYHYQVLVKQKNNNYLNEQAFKHYSMMHEPKCQIFSEEEQQQYLKISRILIRYFLENELRVNILTSNRMKDETKNGHLKILRKVQKKLQTIYRE